MTDAQELDALRADMDARVMRYLEHRRRSGRGETEDSIVGQLTEAARPAVRRLVDAGRIDLSTGIAKVRP